jgi:hypothetical protein
LPDGEQLELTPKENTEVFTPMAVEMTVKNVKTVIIKFYDSQGKLLDTVEVTTFFLQ